MSVANETILNKMKSELSLAIEREKVNSKIMKQHVMKLHLLCELLLEDDQLEVMDKEMISVLSDQTNIKSTREDISQSSINHNGANGDSIFDF